jgi:hypothetical protein
LSSTIGNAGLFSSTLTHQLFSGTSKTTWMVVAINFQWLRQLAQFVKMEIGFINQVKSELANHKYLKNQYMQVVFILQAIFNLLLSNR